MSTADDYNPGDLTRGTARGDEVLLKRPTLVRPGIDDEGAA